MIINFLFLFPVITKNINQVVDFRKANISRKSVDSISVLLRLGDCRRGTPSHIRV
jgi:hypothetical protein